MALLDRVMLVLRNEAATHVCRSAQQRLLPAGATTEQMVDLAHLFRDGRVAAPVTPRRG